MFGRVVNDGQSMLSVRKIEAVPTGVNDRPKLPVRIIGEHSGFLIVWLCCDETDAWLRLLSLPPCRMW